MSVSILVFAILLAGITIGSLVPYGIKIPGYNGPSKIVHFVAYFILAIAAAFVANIRDELIIIFIIIAFISGLIEIIQYFIPGRYASFTDFLVNLLGIGAGGMIIFLWEMFN